MSSRSSRYLELKPSADGVIEAYKISKSLSEVRVNPEIRIPSISEDASQYQPSDASGLRQQSPRTERLLSDNIKSKVLKWRKQSLQKAAAHRKNKISVLTPAEEDAKMSRLSFVQAARKRMSMMIDRNSMVSANKVLQHLASLAKTSQDNRESMSKLDELARNLRQEEKAKGGVRKRAVMRGREGQSHRHLPADKTSDSESVRSKRNYHAAEERAEELLDKVQGIIKRSTVLWRSLDEPVEALKFDVSDEDASSDDDDFSFTRGLTKEKSFVAQQKRHYVNTALKEELAAMKQKVMDKTRGTTNSELIKFLKDYQNLQEFEGQLEEDRESVLKSLHHDFEEITKMCPVPKIDWVKMNCEVGDPDLKDHFDVAKQKIVRSKKIFNEDLPQNYQSIGGLIATIEKGRRQREQKMTDIQMERKRRLRQNYSEKMQEAQDIIKRDVLQACTPEQKRNNIAQALRVKEETQSHLVGMVAKRKELEKELAEKQKVLDEIKVKLIKSDAFAKNKTRRGIKKKTTADLVDFCTNTKHLRDKVDSLIKTKTVEALDDHVQMKKRAKDVNTADPINKLVKDVEEKGLADANKHVKPSSRKEDQKIAATLAGGVQEIRSVQNDIKKELQRVEAQTSALNAPAIHVTAGEGMTLHDLKKLEDKDLEAFITSTVTHLEGSATEDVCKLADFTIKLGDAKTLAGTTKLLGYTEVNRLRHNLLNSSEHSNK